MSQFSLVQRILFAVCTIVVIAIIGAANACPCGPLPGVALWGDLSRQPVEDWGLANEVPLCQLQVRNGILPQSINLNCMSVDGDLFVSCSSCAEKRWSAIAVDHPQGRIRVDGVVYPVLFKRLLDSTELDRAWQARSKKLKLAPAKTRPDDWWSFQLTSSGSDLALP